MFTGVTVAGDMAIMTDTVLYAVVAVLLLYGAYRVFKSWRTFRADDKVQINGEAFSLDALFETVCSSIGVDGKFKSLIRYSFLRSRRQIAAFQAQQDLPLEAVVAFFMAGSALGYAENMRKSERPLEHDTFVHIAEQARAYGEQRAPGQNIVWK